MRVIVDWDFVRNQCVCKSNTITARELVALARLRGEVFFELSLLVTKGVRVGRRLLLGRDIRPLLAILAIDLQPLLEAWLGVGLDRVDRALRLAHPAVDALVRVDDEHVLTFVEAIDRTHLDAIGVLALDAVLVDDVGHAAEVCRSRAIARATAWECGFVPLWCHRSAIGRKRQSRSGLGAATMSRHHPALSRRRRAVTAGAGFGTAPRRACAPRPAGLAAARAPAP